jgi:uncharacterized membrane protein (DUF4010 family)
MTRQSKQPDTTKYEVNEGKNPLEFKTAIIFGLLFAFFSVLTHFVMNRYGNVGVSVLSFIVGVTDIDPYILSLFQGTGLSLSLDVIARATLIATISNNLIKMIYSLILGKKVFRSRIIFGFMVFIVVSLLLVFLNYFLY